MDKVSVISLKFLKTLCQLYPLSPVENYILKDVFLTPSTPWTLLNPACFPSAFQAALSFVLQQGCQMTLI